MNVLEDIRDMLFNELECVAERGQISNGSTLEVIDKLTHSLKSIDTIIAMNEYDDSDYSQRNNGRGNMRYSYASNNYRGDNNMRGGSYNRNSGRYRSRYSREDEREKIVEKLEDYMDSTNSEKVKDAIKKVIEQMDNE